MSDRRNRPFLIARGDDEGEEIVARWRDTVQERQRRHRRFLALLADGIILVGLFALVFVALVATP